MPAQTVGICDVVIPGSTEAAGAIKLGCGAKNAAGDAAGAAVDKVAGSIIEQAANAVAAGVGKVLEVLLTFWVQVPIPAQSAIDAATKVQSVTKWYVGAIAVLSLLIASIRLALSRNSRVASETAQGFLMLAMLSMVGVPALFGAIAISNDFSTWVLGQTAGADLGRGAMKSLAFTGTAGTSVLGPALVIILGVLAILSSLVQIMLMLVRVGVLTLLIGVLPMVAAASTTPTGMAQVRKILTWIVAFILFKPVAALVYGTSFAMLGSAKDPVGQLTGLLMIVLSILALPALMRLITPAVAAATGAAAGAGVGVAAAGALASGARVLADAKGRRGGQGGGQTQSGDGGNPQGAGRVLPARQAKTTFPATSPVGSFTSGVKAAAGATFANSAVSSSKPRSDTKGAPA